MTEQDRWLLRPTPSLWRRFRLLLGGTHEPQPQFFVEDFEVEVERCFTLAWFNEEIPVYFLDIGGAILMLSGQWVSDPHTLQVPDDINDQWEESDSFFRKFHLRFHESGIGLGLTVTEPLFVQAERLPRDTWILRLKECEIIPGTSATIMEDLRRAGIAK